MIGLDGEKMSKSRGNLVFVSKLRAAGRRPERDPSGPARRALPQRPAVDRRTCSPRREERLAGGATAVARDAGPDATELVARLRAHLADDLDTPGALAAVDAWAQEAEERRDRRAAPRLVRDAVDALLGVRL